MKYLSRVVWSEGMYLGPHHFQVQSRYFEDFIQFATTALWFESYGLIGSLLDPGSALQRHRLASSMRAAFSQDGLAFHMPDPDPAPAPRNIAEAFPPARDSIRSASRSPCAQARWSEHLA